MRRLMFSLLVAALVAGGLLSGPGQASAATGDFGHQGRSFSGATFVPTSDKPQSKLWHAHGAWWANKFDTVSQTWHIFRLDRSAQQWVDTGVQVDDRANTLADVLWDGTHVYVASHVVTLSSDVSATPSKPDSPARLYRYSWSVDRGFTPDPGFPVVITGSSSESLTIDKDTTGTLWATWTQVSATSTGGYTSAVYANATSGSDTTWGTPFVLPVPGSTVSQDDISTVVAFGRNRIGILWSNQLDGTVYWAVHDDGAARTSWRGSPAIRGDKQADDHLNIKAVQADTSGRVFAVVKTSLDGSATAAPTDPQLRLLNYRPGTGAWSASTVGTLADCHTRPLLMLDEEHQAVHVFATAPSSGGCPFPGAAGTIYQKSAPMADPVFGPGRGTPVIRDVANAGINDVTSTKQSVGAASGLVVLASNKSTQRYWHADVPLGPVAGQPPVSSFTTSTTSGTAPLAVQFSDTSTGGPTSWAWDFGDGATAGTQHPAHTYTTPGTYTATLTASNAGGAGTPATATITVSVQPTETGVVTAGASSTASSTTAVPDVTIPAPAGVADGTVLVAQITVDGAPSMTSVPAGWTPVLTRALALGTGARVHAYAHVVADAATEPATYTWQLSAAQRWGAGITAFSGVDPDAPFDTAASTAVDTSYAATRLTVPGVTTATPGAMLVGGVGLDNVSNAVTPPQAWSEAWESTGGQVSELATRQTADAGASGALTWSLTRATAAGGWVRALRPVPQAPTASFDASPSAGDAPLPVQFTDTSTGNPTSWAWDFGDGTTATTQHPAHTYAVPGTYTVTLTPTNTVGSGVPVSRTVTVSAPPAVPQSSFTASTTSGGAPLPVQFTDTSTGDPTSWAWDFGDGTTSTAQHPAHTFTKAGTYTVSLVATNRSGAGSAASGTITVTAPPPGVTARASTTAVGSSSTAVTIPRPAGVAAGDVLIAQITANGTPSLAAVPAGWTSVLSTPLVVNSGARVFAYLHVVRDPATEPASVTWQLSAAEKWNAGMTAFTGVDTTQPFDTPVSTAVQKTYTTASLTVPGVTTVTPGAMLVGGLGLDSSATAVTPPSGWTEAFESSGQQVSELAHRATGTAGSSGPATWTLGKGTASGGWLRALRPASTQQPPEGPAAPAASFTSSTTTGSAPLPVQFTDTSTGAPTAWAWDFGDGTTATTQHPAHTYAAAGTYTVTLVATSAGGSSRPATATVTVTAAGAANEVRAGASTTAVSTTAATAVSIGRPAGVVTGDVLVAQITADGTPDMSAVPGGWTPVLSAPLTIGTGARVFVYSHLVTDAAAEPASYTWTLSAAEKWNAGMTAYTGVDPAQPWDTAASTVVQPGYTAATVTVRGVSTVTPGALLIGGIGLGSSAAGVGAPAGWTETWESSGAQTAELAHRTMTEPGASGDATWTLPKSTASAGWLRALRPVR